MSSGIRCASIRVPAQSPTADPPPLLLVAGSPPDKPRTGPVVSELPAWALPLAPLPSGPGPLPLTFEPEVEPHADAAPSNRHAAPSTGQAARENLMPK